MRYIWINPVVKQMYEKKSLNLLLKRHKYTQVECRQNWVRHVHNEYERMVGGSQYPVADVRCPEVSQLLKKEYKDLDILIPEIEPILIHCAKEISRRKDLIGQEKFIITPCQALKKMGNNENLPNTYFMSWKEFLEEIGEKPEAKKLEASPIPPGFFEDIKCSKISITGEKKIRTCLERGEYKEAHIMELLWCRDGCHNGDGVMDLE